MRSLLIFSLLAAACGSGAPAPVQPTATAQAQPTATAQAQPAAATQAQPPEATLPDVPFDKLDKHQRAVFMKQKVMPAMKPIFQDHDPTKYANFGCKTCHGKGVVDHRFDMPNADLPKLNFADMSKFKKTDIAWMEKEVKPTMAKLLQLPEYSSTNPKGFGCLACHTQVGS